MYCQDINYVVLFRKGSCSKAGGNRSYPVVGGNTKAWFTSMQLKCWLPFALSDLGLLTTLLLHACRSLDVLSGFPNYAGMYTAYKHQCIQFTNNSLSFEDTRVSDATIAMVMALLSESVSSSPLHSLLGRVYSKIMSCGHFSTALAILRSGRSTFVAVLT